MNKTAKLPPPKGGITTQAHRERAQDQLSALPAPLRAKAEERSLIFPQSRRTGYFKVVAGKAAPRTAIRFFCIECFGGNENEAKDCPSPQCPLHAYRPKGWY